MNYSAVSHRPAPRYELECFLANDKTLTNLGSGEIMDDDANVRVTDINMPFMSMVVFMIKWAIASIPAMIILGIAGAITAGIFGGIFGGIFR